MKTKRFETLVADGLRSKQMYAPVKTLTERQYKTLKKREFKTASETAADLVNGIKRD